MELYNLAGFTAEGEHPRLSGGFRGYLRLSGGFRGYPRVIGGSSGGLDMQVNKMKGVHTRGMVLKVSTIWLGEGEKILEWKGQGGLDSLNQSFHET